MEPGSRDRVDRGDHRFALGRDRVVRVARRGGHGEARGAGPRDDASATRTSEGGAGSATTVYAAYNVCDSTRESTADAYRS